MLYEFDLLTINWDGINKTMIDLLNEKGADGWAVVHVYESADYSNTYKGETGGINIVSMPEHFKNFILQRQIS